MVTAQIRKIFVCHTRHAIYHSKINFMLIKRSGFIPPTVNLNLLDQNYSKIIKSDIQWDTFNYPILCQCSISRPPDLDSEIMNTLIYFKLKVINRLKNTSNLRNTPNVLFQYFWTKSVCFIGTFLLSVYTLRRVNVYKSIWSLSVKKSASKKQRNLK